jgi:hypothetical protein
VAGSNAVTALVSCSGIARISQVHGRSGGAAAGRSGSASGRKEGGRRDSRIDAAADDDGAVALTDATRPCLHWR